MKEIEKQPLRIYFEAEKLQALKLLGLMNRKLSSTRFTDIEEKSAIEIIGFLRGRIHTLDQILMFID